MNPIETRLHLLVERLRRAGAPVGMTELVDAFQATAVLEIADRSTWRAGLRACLIKSAEHVDVFDDLFDRIFPLADAKSLARSDFDEHSNLGRASTSDGRRSPLRSDQLEADVLDAIGRDDRSALRALAVEAVTAYAALGAGGSSEKQYVMRVLRAMDLANLLQRALRAARTSAGVDAVADYLGRSQAMELIEEFRRLIAGEIGRRLAERQPVETVSTVKYPDDVAFLETSITQRAELRRTVRPLAERLAAHMAQRRRLCRTGRVDVRRTARRSLAYGGVPLEPSFRAKRVSKPDLVVLCDVSGSVSEFAHFMLSLVHALHEELRRLRTFVFVDGIAEVTQLFTDTIHELEPMHLLAQPGVVRGDGHSDYGAVLDDFVRNHLATVVKPSTTVIICGDARTNYRDANPFALERIAERAQAVYWLNPEPTDEWGTTDSAAELYRASCRQMIEVRTTRQLAAAVRGIDNQAR